ncbi:hypothetical protein LLE49_19470 [Alicyclobacillus tolerans]|uniref:hypothetical protein n=1 Tax=Alicyclobacillus tolerans TaxID=90970 RepID=UPI001F39DD76|nr:hypothetical protein [Alicyclobacillus tolerans]MCF8566902.1 hypothetical protein [Alicyclobacillus tolerans]
MPKIELLYCRVHGHGYSTGCQECRDYNGARLEYQRENAKAIAREVHDEEKAKMAVELDSLRAENERLKQTQALLAQAGQNLWAAFLNEQ